MLTGIQLQIKHECSKSGWKVHILTGNTGKIIGQLGTNLAIWNGIYADENIDIERYKFTINDKTCIDYKIAHSFLGQRAYFYNIYALTFQGKFCYSCLNWYPYLKPLDKCWQCQLK